VEATAEDYKGFVEGLTGADRELALAAGLDVPPEDGAVRSGEEVREYDGLAVYLRNGSVKVAPDRPQDSEDPEPAFREDLATALRAIFMWLLRGTTAANLFKKPQAVVVRLWALCRILRLNDFDRTSIARAAEQAGLTRAALSKASVEIRSAVGQRFFCVSGDRETYREQARRVALRSWEKRRAKDLSHLSQTS